MDKKIARYDPHATGNVWKWVCPTSGQGKTKTVKDKSFHTISSKNEILFQPMM
jgi:hypothetical protein